MEAFRAQGPGAPTSQNLRSVHDGLRAAIGRVLAVVILGILPLVMLARFALLRETFFGFDFHVFWQAGRDFVHGTSPYPAQTADVIASKENFVYPAWVAAALAPIGLLPYSVAVTVFSVILIASMALALH